jgi:hypothetical protein
MSLVISLSAIPPRFSELQPALEGLLKQTAKIDEIRLYIPKKYRRFPDWDGQLPDVPHGVTIIQPDADLGPATKVLFAAQDLAGTDTDLIYCDDDRIYHPEWFERMISARGDRTDIAVATSVLSHLDKIGLMVPPSYGPRPRHRNTPLHVYRLMRRKLKQLVMGVTDPKPHRAMQFRRAGFDHIAEGLGAVLIKPDFFDETMFDIPPILWTVDDIWLSGHLERKGIGILCAAGFGIPPETGAADEAALHRSVIEGANRREADSACVKYMQETYGIWL